ncbi:MAG: DMT family transporter [Alphaproteobacteria bacterium]|nr:DMT family transporter [Alphaproteobacteria bacterium]
MSQAPASGTRPQPLPAAGFFLLAGVTLFWGANWPGMKIALSELPVWWFRTMSVGFGAAGLLIIARVTHGTIRIPAREIGPLVLCAMFAFLGWHIFAAYGVSQMPAGRASIIAFTMPVWASIFGSFLIGEPFTKPKVIGLLLGLAGLAVLMGEDLLVFGSAPVGAMFMLLAAISWGFGTVLFKRFTWTAPVATVVGWQLFAAVVPIAVVALVTEPMPDLTQLSLKAILALAYLFALPMVFCQWAYFKVVSIFPAAIAAMGTLAVPIVGVYSSALILGEPVGWQELTALVLICSALASVLVVPALLNGRGRT